MNTQNGMSDTKVKLPLPPFSITAKDYRWYDLAMKTAALSQCRYRIGSVIIGKGSNVLSLGVNVLKSHSDHIHWPHHVISTHSEHNCIRHARHRNIDLRGTVIYVARDGGNMIGKPCDKCMEYIYIAGIKTVVYSNGTDLVKMRV